MTLTEDLTRRAADLVSRRTSRRGFLGRTAVVGSALTVAGPSYVLRPGTAYAAVTKVSCGQCGGGLCCDGYTEFCCHINPDGANQCPPGTLLAGWWKVDNSAFCLGTARYYMDCNTASPRCRCGSSGSCQDNPGACGCRDCQSRKDSCTVFRYGNCNNHIGCVGPIICRVVTCTRPWEIEPTCSQVPRTDERTRNHHRPCLERDPTAQELAFVRTLYVDFLGRTSDATGEAHWGQQMVRGAHLGAGGRSRVGYSFGYSDEYATAVTRRTYERYLERGAEPGGLAHWSSVLRQGRLTPEDLAVELLASDELYRKAGSTPEGFVRVVYRRCLRREATEADVRDQAERMAAGRTRKQVAQDVFRSEESRRTRVTDLYQLFLRRNPDQAGRDYWVRILGSQPDISLAVFLAASDEYFEKASWREAERVQAASASSEPATAGASG
jgi:hypothetical protein